MHESEGAFCAEQAINAVGEQWRGVIEYADRVTAASPDEGVVRDTEALGDKACARSGTAEGFGDVERCGECQTGGNFGACDSRGRSREIGKRGRVEGWQGAGHEEGEECGEHLGT